jgi:uncharacterized protein
MNDWLTKLIRLPGSVLIFFVRGYQRGISPMFGPKCRFTPSCSEYYVQSVQKYGAVRGSLRGMRRLLRCHPFHPGGYDPP